MTKSKQRFVPILLLLISSAEVFHVIKTDPNLSIATPDEKSSKYFDATCFENFSRPSKHRYNRIIIRKTVGAIFSRNRYDGETCDYTNEIVSGELPLGLIISQDGTMSGWLKTGTFKFTVRVTNIDGTIDEWTFEIEIEKKEGWIFELINGN